MWQVVNGAGTASSARIAGFDVSGKTGTAQVVSKRTGATGDEKEHAWFVAYAPKDEPEIAGVIIVEHGGHGGSIAAPIMKACFEEYLRKKKGLAKNEEPLAQLAPTKINPSTVNASLTTVVKPAITPTNQATTDTTPAIKPPRVRPPAPQVVSSRIPGQ
jgi:membrane peptidoglycan carboxypeptidase